MIRIKDVHSNGIASGLELPQTAVFDMDINLILTRNQTKSKKQAGYKFMPTVQTFDYLPIGSKEDYPISFRIARFKIADDSYETVITNLDRFCFSAEKLKELYHLRWGIETSFRELKYAIGLTSFHAKKVDYIKQEIFREDAEKCMEAGMNAHLSKPIVIEEVIKTILRYVHND